MVRDRIVSEVSITGTYRSIYTASVRSSFGGKYMVSIIGMYVYRLVHSIILGCMGICIASVVCRGRVIYRVSVVGRYRFV
jgi:hypothetical protein